MTTADPSLPLVDVRVVEVDSWMAAPSAGAILADLGADVIKVEPPGGDPMRGTGRPPKIEGGMRDHDLQFDVDNRGKRSIAVALDTDAGAHLVRRLCGRADVFLCNLLPHRQRRFGLDPQTLLGEHGRLVHATLTGYGTEGPEAWRPGYDVTAFFGRSGLYDAMREGPDGLVPMARPAQGDHTAGLALVTAILAALRVVERTGEGQVVETSLYETAVWTQATDFAVTAVDGAPVRRRARHQQIIITANRFPCGDGRWLVVNMPEDSAWPRVCRALGLEHLLDDARLQTVKGRFDNMAELVDVFDEAFSSRPRDEWGAIFDEHGLIWGPVLSLPEVAADPQAAAIGLFPTVPHPEHGTYRTVRIPMRFTGGAVGPHGPAPTVGEHTADVLAALGLDAGDVASLVADGVVFDGGADGR